jgi:hypothetical protein
MRHARALRHCIAVVSVFLAGACQSSDKGAPQSAPQAAAATSDPGCPAPITITSGTGNNQVPVMFLAASGDGSGAQRAALVKEFNSRAAEIAFKHCLDGGCLCEYTPAESKNIKLATMDFSGWTEVTILPTGGQPVVLPPGTTKRGGFIVPPSPNVVCKLPPKLPIPPRETTTGETTTGETTTGQPPERPPVVCKQPTWSKPAGTIVAEKRFPFDPIDSGKANADLADYVNNHLQQDIDLTLNAWLAEINIKCQALNPGGRCKAAFDPEPSFKTETGDSGLGSQLFIVYRVKLAVEVKGKCIPK